MTRRRRSLTGDELALWAHVTRHVAPMPGRQHPEAPPPPPEPSKAEPALPAAAATAAVSPAPPGPKPPPALVPLERRLRQRLARGHHPIDAVIDLHGMRQDEAHFALRSFLLSAQVSGYAIVLVVTGKGGQGLSAPGNLFEERGVLRRVVPHWLRLPDLRAVVVGFEEAATHHGGAGALYVRLRRRRGGGAS